MDTLVLDLRYALRTLARSPGFTAAAALTLALGIGANTAVFSVVQHVLLAPLGLPREERLVTVWQDERVHGGPATEWTGRSVFDGWRRGNETFDGMTVVSDWLPQVTGADRPEALNGAVVSHEYFDVLGVRPALGRAFRSDEEVAGKDRVVVLSDALWRRRFGGDPGLVGRTISLDGESYTVLGVLPPGFRPPLVSNAEIWSVLAFDPGQSDWGNVYLRAIGRLRAGVSATAAKADLDRVTAGLGKEHPAELEGVRATLEPLRETVLGPATTPILALQGAALLVLLIACANIANLFIARASARQRELSVRTALGAGRSRLMRQLLTESLMLAAAGGALGLLLASWGIRALEAAAPAGAPRMESLALNGQVVGFALGATLVTGLLFGLAPLAAIARNRLGAGLHGGSRTGGPRDRQRLRSALVVVEVALGLALLVGAGLLIRTLDALHHVDPGFRADHLASGRLIFPSGRYPETTGVVERVDRILERLRARGDVDAAGAVSTLPFSGGQFDVSFVIEGRIPPAGEEPATDFRRATPGYFGAMSIPLRAGRSFDSGDVDGRPRVALINERLAERFFPGEDPLGHRLRVGGVRDPDSPWWTIVGVVGSVRDNTLDKAPDPEVYLPFAQRPGRVMSLVVRSDGPPEALLQAVLGAVGEVDPDQAVTQLATLDDLIATTLSPTRFLTGLLAAFAALALLLAGVGIYGVMAFAVGRRTHEIGVRMALGARPGSVLGLVLRQGAALTGAGLALGLFAAWGLSRGLAGLLYGIGADDPWTLGAVCLLLAGVALVATWLPARRAAGVDPVEALKSE